MLTDQQLNATLITVDRNKVQVRSLLGVPLVLAFFPAAFTSVCTEELCTFRDSISRFNAVKASVYGVSIDTPFTLKVFAEQNQLNFALLSDANREATRAFDVVWPDLAGVRETSNRAVFVIDSTGNTVYSWVAEKPGIAPPFEDILTAVTAAT